MPSKLFYFLLSVALIGGMALFAWTNSSYQKAFEAEWHYLVGEYDEAYHLAKEAYALDHYNRFALTVMTRTENARTYLAFIREGLTYLDKIQEIADRNTVTKADRARIRMMCEVMIQRYETLAKTPLSDEDLVMRAERIDADFKEIYRKLFGKIGKK